MGLVLKHVKRTPNGGYEYRRRVPKDIIDTIGKREFKKVLGASEPEALRQYPKTHESVERQISSARHLHKRRKLAANGELGGLALREIVEDKVANLLAGSTNPDEIREIIADNLLEGYPRGPSDGNSEGDPIDVPEVDRLAIQLLRDPDAPRPAPTLQDAYELYIKENLAPSKADEHRKAKQHNHKGN